MVVDACEMTMCKIYIKNINFNNILRLQGISSLCFISVIKYSCEVAGEKSCSSYLLSILSIVCAWLSFECGMDPASAPSVRDVHFTN